MSQNLSGRRDADRSPTASLRKQLPVRMPGHLYLRLSAIAEAQHRSMNSVICEALATHLDRVETVQGPAGAGPH